jgi:quercetin dioxygenase-like cupin family protein
MMLLRAPYFMRGPSGHDHTLARPAGRRYLERSIMSPQPPLAPAIVAPGQGRVLRAFGDEVTLHLTGEETGGKFAQFTVVTPPGGGPPPHHHAAEDEWFFVLEGSVSFLAQGQWREVAPGGIAFVPRKSVHTFKNVGTTPLRLLVTTSPAGFERFFARCADEFAKPGGPQMDRIVAISAEHGIHFEQS